jgi:hypothetical protein
MVSDVGSGPAGDSTRRPNDALSRSTTALERRVGDQGEQTGVAAASTSDADRNVTYFSGLLVGV